MNMKPISTIFLLLGVLMLALSAYQTNQYLTTQPAVKQTIKGSDALIAQGATSAEVEPLTQMVTETSNAYMQTAGIDFILGLVFVFLGVMTSPKERERSGI